MPVLCVPNWSLGRERTVVREIVDYLETAPVTVHFAEADIDHNRTVTAISGSPQNVQDALLHLAEMILPAIDLNRHVGVHPRIGGLDVCPFVPLPEQSTGLAFEEFVEDTARKLADKFDIPILLYEKSSRPGKTVRLPELRRGGFGGLIDRHLDSDFGPSQAHPQLGATCLGWRPFLVALNVNFPGDAVNVVQHIAANIRHRRSEGDPRFEGVRALGFHLVAQELVQVSLNFTAPERAGIDPVIEYVQEQADRAGMGEGYVQLIGVIRDTDLEHALLVPFRPEQVVQSRMAGDWVEDWP